MVTPVTPEEALVLVVCGVLGILLSLWNPQEGEAP